MGLSAGSSNEGITQCPESKLVSVRLCDSLIPCLSSTVSTFFLSSISKCGIESIVKKLIGTCNGKSASSVRWICSPITILFLSIEDLIVILFCALETKACKKNEKKKKTLCGCGKNINWFDLINQRFLLTKKRCKTFT